MSELRAATSEQAEKVLALELRRLDALTAAHWPAAMGGDVQATGAVLKCMDRRARLLGLDQPERHEMALTPDLIAREIQRLEAELGINDGSSL